MPEFTVCKHCQEQAPIENNVSQCGACGWWFDLGYEQEMEESRRLFEQRRRAMHEAAMRRADQIRAEIRKQDRSRAARAGWQTRREREAAWARDREQAQERAFSDRVWADIIAAAGKDAD